MSSVIRFDPEMVFDLQSSESAATAARAVAQLGLRIELSGTFHAVQKSLKSNKLVEWLESIVTKSGSNHGVDAILGALFASNLFGDALGFQGGGGEEALVQAHDAAVAVALTSTPPSPPPTPPALDGSTGLDRKPGFITRWTETHPPSSNAAIDTVQDLLAFLDVYSLRVYSKEFSPPSNEELAYSLSYNEVRLVLIKVLLRRTQSVDGGTAREIFAGEYPRARSARAALSKRMLEDWRKEVLKAEEKKAGGHPAVLVAGKSTTVEEDPSKIAVSQDSSIVTVNGVQYTVKKGLKGQGRRALKRNLAAEQEPEDPDPAKRKRNRKKKVGDLQPTSTATSSSMQQQLQHAQTLLQQLGSSLPQQQFGGVPTNFPQQFYQPPSHWPQPPPWPPQMQQLQQLQPSSRVHVCRAWMRKACSDPCPRNERHNFKDQNEKEFLEKKFGGG